MSEYRLIERKFNSSQISDFLKLMNQFRAEYFADNPPKNLTILDFVSALDNPAYLPVLIYRHNRPVAVVEITISRTYAIPTVSICTIYVIPQYRNGGIAESIYNWYEEKTCDMETQTLFAIQVEESKLYKNKQRLLNAGFAFYAKIDEMGDIKYNEATFLLFRKQHFKRLAVLEKLELEEAA